MNDSRNYADFVGMKFSSADDSEPYDYQQETPLASSNTDEPYIETSIESMLLSHSKYHIYCE